MLKEVKKRGRDVAKRGGTIENATNLHLMYHHPSASLLAGHGMGYFHIAVNTSICNYWGLNINAIDPSFELQFNYHWGNLKSGVCTVSSFLGHYV